MTALLSGHQPPCQHQQSSYNSARLLQNCRQRVWYTFTSTRRSWRREHRRGSLDDNESGRKSGFIHVGIVSPRCHIASSEPDQNCLGQPTIPALSGSGLKSEVSSHVVGARSLPGLSGTLISMSKIPLISGCCTSCSLTHWMTMLSLFGRSGISKASVAPV